MKFSNFSGFIKDLRDSALPKEQYHCRQVQQATDEFAASSVRHLTIVFDRKRHRLYEAHKRTYINDDGHYCEALYERIHTPQINEEAYVLESTSDVINSLDYVGSVGSDYSSEDVAFNIGAALSRNQQNSSMTFQDAIRHLDVKIRNNFDTMNRFGKIDPQYLHAALYESRAKLTKYPEQVNCLRVTLIHNSVDNHTCISMEMLHINDAYEFFKEDGDHSLGVKSASDINRLQNLVCDVFRIQNITATQGDVVQGYFGSRFPDVVSHLLNSTDNITTPQSTTAYTIASDRSTNVQYNTAFDFVSPNVATYIHNNFAYMAAGMMTGIAALVASTIAMCVRIPRLRQFISLRRYTQRHSIAQELEMETRDRLLYEKAPQLQAAMVELTTQKNDDNVDDKLTHVDAIKPEEAASDVQKITDEDESKSDNLTQDNDDRMHDTNDNEDIAVTETNDNDLDNHYYDNQETLCTQTKDDIKDQTNEEDADHYYDNQEALQASAPVSNEEDADHYYDNQEALQASAPVSNEEDAEHYYDNQEGIQTHEEATTKSSMIDTLKFALIRRKSNK